MNYIYVVYSDQFGSDNYKVGYTTNPSQRINDSCYTTTYISPCTFKYIWKFTCDNNPICIEKELHLHLSSKVKSLYVKGFNQCREMYNSDLDTLKIIIDEFLKENCKSVLLIDFSVNHQNNDDQSLINFIEIAQIRGSIKPNKNQPSTCDRCNRKHWRVNYRVIVDDIQKNFGANCFAKLAPHYIEKDIEKESDKLVEEYIKPQGGKELYDYLFRNINIEKIVSKKLNKLLLSDMTNIEKYNNINEIICNLTIKDIECKCCFLYGLSELLREFNKVCDYKIDIKIFNNICAKIVNNKNVTFKNFISNMKHLFEITDKYIINLPKKNMIENIHTYFQNDKICDKRIILGAAGTGKSTDITGSNEFNTRSALYDYLSCKNIKGFILCPTGKATAEIKKKFNDRYIDENNENYENNMKTLEKNIFTIDMFLQNRNYNDYFDTMNLLIIDEISMVTLYKIYKIINIKCDKLILMGDFLQLPPVKSHTIHDIINEYKNITHEKTEVKRTDTLTQIYKDARDVNFSIENLADCKYNCNYNICIDNNEIIKENIINAIDKAYSYYDNIDLISSKDSYEEVISDTHNCEKQYGSKNQVDIKILVYKNLLRNKLYDIFETNKKDIYITDDSCVPIHKIPKSRMMTKNIYDDGKLKYYNGEENPKLDISSKNIEIENDSDTESEQEIIGNKSIEEYLERSEIITIHKAQGSGFEHVILILEDDNISHALLYTALTRAKKSISVIHIKNEEKTKLDKYYKWCYEAYSRYKSSNGSKIKKITSDMKTDIHNFYKTITDTNMRCWCNSINTYFVKLSNQNELFMKDNNIKKGLIKDNHKIYELFIAYYKKIYKKK